MRIALHQHTVLWRPRLIFRLQSLPSSPAKRVIHIQAKLREGPVSHRLHHPRQACLRRCIQLPFAHTRVLQAVFTRLPRLRPVQHHHSNPPRVAQMVDAPCQLVRIYRAPPISGVRQRHNLAANRPHRASGLQRSLPNRSPVQHNYAQIGPTAIREINR